ncbi:MAG TPA: putative peptidoglycan glycosyltransferase FtsW [Candidatus Paceibacterota bacterium]|nr:putative peptidoglycan glycosyltransferase FtsW [Candidatus Paceibacterota bacterium]
MTRGIDRFFLGIIIVLLAVGILVFLSAAMGVLAKNASKFYNILFNQLVLGLLGGLLLMYLTSRINYKFWRKYSFWFFFSSILLTVLVFVPGLGLRHGGALRWVSLGPVSFQPVEFLKIGFLIYFAGWLAWVKSKVENFRFGILPFVLLIGVVAVILLKQPDTKNFVLIVIGALAMFLLSGVKWRHIFWIGLGLAVLLGGLFFTQPYLKERLKTYLDPSRDPTGSSYQIQQSLIGIGSGGIFGRGYGQSVQKFSFLPEPQGDSIFAVIGEEFGFVGSAIIVILYVIFGWRGLWIANRAPDIFSRLLVTGIVILITAQAFLNIASAIAVFPLTGVPLPLISHGGTSLFMTLGALGIVLNISKYCRRI